MTKIVLYHFTPKRALNGILNAGRIEPSRIAQPDGSVLDYAGVSLTSDTDPNGHGLPDGRIITNAQADELPLYIRIGKHKYCEDAREYRFDLVFDTEDPKLKQALSYYASAQLGAIDALEVRGYFPVDTRPTGAQLRDVRDKIANGSLVGKAKTWWYYLGEINISSSPVIFRRNAQGEYLPFSSSIP